MVTYFAEPPLVVATPATSSWILFMYMTNNVLFGVDILRLNFTSCFPIRTFQHQSLCIPPRVEPCFNLLEMLNKLKVQSGTSASGCLGCHTQHPGMSPIAMDFFYLFGCPLQHSPFLFGFLISIIPKIIKGPYPLLRPYC